MAIHAPVILTDAQRELLAQYLQQSTKAEREFYEAMSTDMMSDAKGAYYDLCNWVAKCTGLPPVIHAELQARLAGTAAIAFTGGFAVDRASGYLQPIGNAQRYVQALLATP